MITQQQIENFLASKIIAIAGVSRNPKKFGHEVFIDLLNKGYTILPINPEATEINGIKCYKNVSALPDGIENIYIITPSSQTGDVVKQAVKKNIRRIWIQQMSETPESIELATKAGIDLIYNKCILMFTEPVKGVHLIHRFLLKIFGKLPK